MTIVEIILSMASYRLKLSICLFTGWSRAVKTDREKWKGHMSGGLCYLATGCPACSGRRCGWAGTTRRRRCSRESAGSCWGLRPRFQPAFWGKAAPLQPAAALAPGRHRPSGAPAGSRLFPRWPARTRGRSLAHPWTLDWWRQMESLKEQRWQRHNI